MAHSGWDWLVVDGEHSPVDLLTMVQMFQAISTTDTIPMARVTGTIRWRLSGSSTAARTAS